MAKESVKDYWISKLLFPKTFIIDKPGVIINCVARRYGGIRSRQRTVFFFEDILSNLQIKTIKELGERKTSELWYRIGKDIGIRYLLLSKAKKRPPSFLLPLAVDYIFSGFKSAGMSVAESIDYNPKRKLLVLEGKDNVLCRKTKQSSITVGVISAVLSFLLGENIEAESQCQNCPSGCKIIASPLIKEKYIPEIKDLHPLKNYDSLNFPQPDNIKIKKDSFSDLLKFKKIWFSKSGKICFMNKTIVPNEPGTIELIAKSYARIGKHSLFERGVVNGAEQVAKDILDKTKRPEENIKIMENIFCAFGRGISFHKREGKSIILNFVYPPISKYGFLYFSLVLNGFLNYIFSKKFKITSIKKRINPLAVTLKYSF